MIRPFGGGPNRHVEPIELVLVVVRRRHPQEKFARVLWLGDTQHIGTGLAAGLRARGPFHRLTDPPTATTVATQRLVRQRPGRLSDHRFVAGWLGTASPEASFRATQWWTRRRCCSCTRVRVRCRRCAGRGEWAR